MQTTRLMLIEKAIVTLIAAHSYLVGLALLLVPHFCLKVGGWESGGTTFFVKQAGAFHLVVATGYLIEYLRRQSVAFLVTTKSIATIFLLSIWIGGAPQWAIPVSAVGDGLMLLVVAVLKLRFTHNRPHLSEGS